MKNLHDQMKELLVSYLAEGVHTEKRRLCKVIEQTIDDMKFPDNADPVQVKELIKKAVLAEIRYEERGTR